MLGQILNSDITGWTKIDREKIPEIRDKVINQEISRLMVMVTDQIDGFGGCLAGIRAPSLTPEPFLWQRKDRHVVNHVVGEVLVQICQTVRILTQSLGIIEIKVLISGRSTSSGPDFIKY
jgi:hypothetical protein